jgi:GTPase KRas protein
LNEVKKGCGDVPIIVVGNKVDLKAVVKPKEGQRLADEHALTFVNTSAKDDINTDEAFYQLANLILDRTV